MATVVKARELELQPEEAKQYAEALALVSRHYDVGASAKTLDLVNLATTMASIYGVKIMMILARRDAERRGVRPAAPGMGHNGGPAMNGHDAPPAEAEAIDFSLMTGPAGNA